MENQNIKETTVKEFSKLYNSLCQERIELSEMVNRVCYYANEIKPINRNLEPVKVDSAIIKDKETGFVESVKDQIMLIREQNKELAIIVEHFHSLMD